MQFYIALNAIPHIAMTMKEDMKRGGLELDKDKWEDVVDSLLSLLKTELMEHDRG